jgi:hypothetical protein
MMIFLPRTICNEIKSTCILHSDKNIRPENFFRQSQYSSSRNRLKKKAYLYILDCSLNDGLNDGFKSDGGF